MIFTGTGPQINQLNDIATTYNVQKQIVFTGFVNWELVYRLYSLSDVFVTASTSEVQPMTLIEASMCGLPLIARDDESYHDLIIHNENGYLAQNDEELYEYLSDLIYNEEKCKEFSRKSLVNSEQFTAAHHASRMAKLYETVIAHYPEPLELNSLT